MMHWNKHPPPHWHTTNDNTPPDPAILDSTPYGSAGKRTETQTTAALAYGTQLIASIPTTHHIAYTDGSAKHIKHKKTPRTNTPHPPMTKPLKPTPNPGPCGSGVCLTLPRTTHNTPDILAIAPLGKGTNNIGELFAIGMAIDMFLAHSNENDTLHILTDSKLTALLIEHGAHARANKALVQAVRHKYWLARTTRRVRVRWLPAHIGLRGNEDADALADEGARLSAQGVGYTPAQLRARIYNRTFYGPSDKQNTQPRDFFNRPIPTSENAPPPP